MKLYIPAIRLWQLALALLLCFQQTVSAQNNCLHFDGVDDYVDLGTLNPTDNFSTGFTFMGCMKWNERSTDAVPHTRRDVAV
jgi:hypothetical protein